MVQEEKLSTQTSKEEDSRPLLSKPPRRTYNRFTYHGVKTLSPSTRHIFPLLRDGSPRKVLSSTHDIECNWNCVLKLLPQRFGIQSIVYVSEYYQTPGSMRLDKGSLKRELGPHYDGKTYEQARWYRRNP